MQLSERLRDYFPSLRRALANAGVSEDEFARSIGMDPAQLSRYMTYEIDVRLSTVLRVEAGLDKLWFRGLLFDRFIRESAELADQRRDA